MVIEPAAFKAGQGARAGGIGYEIGCAPTLMGAASGTNQVPAVVQAKRPGRRPRCQWIVRLITPTEALRLQGFDDDWFDGIRYRNAPLSDSAKYKMVGNSWAVPCAGCTLERMARMDEIIREEEAAAVLPLAA